MNIKEAKDEIKRSVEIYLDKDEFGEYTIPVSKQRPILMLGAPGIGKTAVMQQIASELDVALVSCSMSHPARQGTPGLPERKARDHDGMQAPVPAYTMGGIISAVYRVMRDSGKKEGILFLDGITGVPETLLPDVLLFLQYKILGNRKLPGGWAVVTAGNPPGYYTSVREFDVSVLDRVKRIHITEDFSVWKQYAYRQGIHAAVLSFLENRREWFYSVRPAAEGVRYVTARGWEDLSAAMRLYEKKGFAVSRRLIGQYITDEEIAEGFGSYYERFQRYRAEYPVAEILSGRVSGDLLQKSRKAEAEERTALLCLILEILWEGFRRAAGRERSLQMEAGALRGIKKAVEEDRIPVSLLLQEQTDRIQKQLRERKAANSITAGEQEEYLAAVRTLAEYQKYPDTGDLKKDFEKIRRQSGRSARQHEKQTAQVKAMLEAAVSFIERSRGNRREMERFLTDLTCGEDVRAFLSRWGCEDCFRLDREQRQAV